MTKDLGTKKGARLQSRSFFIQEVTQEKRIQTSLTAYRDASSELPPGCADSSESASNRDSPSAKTGFQNSSRSPGNAPRALRFAPGSLRGEPSALPAAPRKLPSVRIALPLWRLRPVHVRLGSAPVPLPSQWGTTPPRDASLPAAHLPETDPRGRWPAPAPPP